MMAWCASKASGRARSFCSKAKHRALQGSFASFSVIFLFRKSDKPQFLAAPARSVNALLIDTVSRGEALFQNVYNWGA
jgi:hypothetical protein